MRTPLLFVVLLLFAAPVAAAEPITLVAVGDLMLAGSAAETLERRGFAHPFTGTLHFIAAADLAMANLEAPLTDSEEEFTGKRFRFKTPPAAAAAVRAAGFDVLTLANNHILDFGVSGLRETLETLDGAGIARAGAGGDLTEARRAAVVERRGQKVAFLAYSNTFPTEFWAGKERAGTAPGWPELIKNDVARASLIADYVVVSFHWGAERMTEPKDYQRRLARLAVDNGAQVVLGHHPHVLQGVERYRGAVIYYSLGNYAFGSYSENARIGALARILLDEGGVKEAQILPLDVYNARVGFSPQPIASGTNYAFAREFGPLCAPLDTAIEPRCDLFWSAVPASDPPSSP